MQGAYPDSWPEFVEQWDERHETEDGETLDGFTVVDEDA